MQVKTLMSKDISTISPETPVRDVMGLMSLRDIGILPVCEDGRVVGILTDRDIVTRLLSEPEGIAGCRARDIMSCEVICCHAQQEVAVVAGIMGDHQIRRLPVLNGDVLVGMVTVGDIARDVSEHLAGETLGEIVEVR